MALATKCPHCNTVFRVAADQLKLRGGIVRCGACNEVFDGNAALVEPAAKPTPVIPEVVVTPASAAADYIHGEPLDFDLDALDTDEPLIQSDEDLAASTASVDELLSGIELDFDDEPAAATPDTGQEPAMPAAKQSPAPAAKRWFATSAPPAAPEPASESESVWQPAAASEPEQRAEAWSAHELAREPDVASEPEHELAHDSEGMPEPEPTAEGALEPEPATDDAAPEPHQPHAADAESPAADVDAAFEAEPCAESDLPAAESAYEAELPAAPSLTDAHGRIEPSFDTPQEHIVAAALDDLHHFDDLDAREPEPIVAREVEPEAEPEAALEPVPEASTGGWTESAFEPLPEDATETTFEASSEPTFEPAFSTTPRNETALHAIAAVSTDARDDAESLPDDEPEDAPSAAKTDAASDPELDHEELGFVKRANRSEKYGRSAKLAMAFGTPLLLAGLLLQGATTFRNTLAANYPELKPTLTAACGILGCKVELPTQLDMLSIEQGELQTVADNTFSFSTTLRNQARTAQAWPHIELVLNDSADKPVVRRVFAPRDYLVNKADADKGFSARSEQSVKLYFELSQLKASGYHIAIFYP